jgi:hypothetical protein
MTEQDFRQELDAVITKGLNNLDTGIIYGVLSATKQFVEVVYDIQVAEHIANMRIQQEQLAQEKGELVTK